MYNIMENKLYNTVNVRTEKENRKNYLVLK